MEEEEELMIHADDPLLVKSNKRPAPADKTSVSKRARHGFRADLKPRKYQIEALEKALSENTILFLETGTGKTLIAGLLVEKLADRLLMPNEKRVAVFLAPTVHLVNQQAEFMSNYLNELKVGVYHGQNTTDIDDWSNIKWREEVDSHHVLVMTPQVFYDALELTALSMNLVELLIIDECHHAQKNHPYALIMKTYYHSLSLTKRPRIFGMTASLLLNGTTADYAQRITDLEIVLNAKVYTIKDREELEVKAPIPVHRASYYAKGAYDYDSLRSRLVEVREQYANEEKILLRFGHDSKLSTAILKSIKKVHLAVDYCLVELGTWCASLAVDFYEKRCSDPSHRGDETVARSYTNSFLQQLSGLLACNRIEGSCWTLQSEEELEAAVQEGVLTPKVKQLLVILQKYRTIENVRSIVFVERVITSAVLANLVNFLRCLDFLRAGCLSGKARTESADSQKETLESFRDGQLNLLVATSVAEEGLDVQMCNSVVRFDFCTGICSYIQSRGRARKPGAEYVWLLEKDNLKHEGELLKLRESEKAIKDEALSRSEKAIDRPPPVDDDLEVFEASCGFRISTSGSINLIHRYCSKLPRDKYYEPNPEFSYTQDNPELYTCTIKFPPNAPLRSVQGSPRRTRELSKRRACLEACKHLYELGELTATNIKTLGCKNTLGLGSTKLKELTPSIRLSSTLQGTWIASSTGSQLYSYTLIFSTEAPDTPSLTSFAFILNTALEDDVGNCEVELYHRKGRVIKALLSFSEQLQLDVGQLAAAKLYQEIMFNGAYGRLVFWEEGAERTHRQCLLTSDEKIKGLWSQSYLLLPLGDDKQIDWTIILATAEAGRLFKDLCVFPPKVAVTEPQEPTPPQGMLRTANGLVQACKLLGSVVLTIHTGKLFCIEGVLHEKTAEASLLPAESYADFFLKKYGRALQFRDQPLLRAKPTHAIHNQLIKTVPASHEDVETNFVELPAELCLVIGSKSSIIRSLYFVPSVIYRLTALVIASELRAKYPFHAQAFKILEALTSNRCQEGFSYESLEFLGDSVLKMAVSQKMFLTYPDEHEGRLSDLRSDATSNAALRKAAVGNGLHFFIRDEPFCPKLWFGAGMYRLKRRDCRCILSNLVTDGSSLPKLTKHQFHVGKTCGNGHRWLCSKVVADVVEALIGAYALGDGFAAATEFMKAIGIDVNFDQALIVSLQQAFLVPPETVEKCLPELEFLEKKLSYVFHNKALLLQAITHPSFSDTNFSYERLEFLGDAALDLLITDHLFKGHPASPPGFLTDLKCAAVSNNCFGRVAVKHNLHVHLRYSSQALEDQIAGFVKALAEDSQEQASTLGFKALCAPKALADLVEGIAGAILLDSNFNLAKLWEVMEPLMCPLVSPAFVALHPMKQLQEVCCLNYFQLSWNVSRKEGGEALAEAIVQAGAGRTFSETSSRTKKRSARLDAAYKMLARLKNHGYRHPSEPDMKDEKGQLVPPVNDESRSNLFQVESNPTIVSGNCAHCGPEFAAETILKFSGCISKPLAGVVGELNSDLPTKPGQASPCPAKDAQLIGSLPDIQQLGAARSYLFDLAVRKMWTRPKFEDQEKAIGSSKLFAATVIMDASTHGCFKETGDFMSNKRRARDEAAKKLVLRLSNEGII